MKKFFLFVSILVLFYSTAFAKKNVFIIAKVNEKIVTSLDLEKEALYLKILNPQLEKIGKDKILKISKNSLINEIIKKDETKKFFDYNQKLNITEKIFEDFHNSLGFPDKERFLSLLSKKKTYSEEEIKEKLKIEFFWNRIILEKFNDLVKIDKQQLIKKIENINIYKNEYQLSEILFSKDKDLTLNEKIEKIKNSIDTIGFNNTASLFSNSKTANVGGNIGWIPEESLSQKIIDELKNIKVGDHTGPIQFGSNFLILKIENKKQKKIQSNKEKMLDQMIKFETNKQLNQFSNIYFNKIKINYSINET